MACSGCGRRRRHFQRLMKQAGESTVKPTQTRAERMEAKKLRIERRAERIKLRNEMAKLKREQQEREKNQ